MLVKSQSLVVYFVAWTLFVLALLTLSNLFSYETFFILAYMGVVIITGLTCPYMAKPKWVSRINLIIFIGLLIFCLFVLKEALNIIGLSLIP